MLTSGCNVVFSRPNHQQEPRLEQEARRIPLVNIVLLKSLCIAANGQERSLQIVGCHSSQSICIRNDKKSRTEREEIIYGDHDMIHVMSYHDMIHVMSYHDINHVIMSADNDENDVSFLFI